jgi:NAD(P)-dependent dehydrogenase (short-subunit alcohol dehydrogenase family)
LNKRLQDRIALVTGASRGIGAAVAQAYAREGAHLILVARNEAALEEIDDEIKTLGGTATLVPMDLAAENGIEDLSRQIYERWGKLDILVGNAAVLGELTPIGHIDPQKWQEAIAVNLTANWRLLRSMDPLLRQSDAGRAIFLTTGATRALPPYWGTYSVTKAALEALVGTYAHEIEKTSVRANLVNPGPTRTRLRAQAFPGEDGDSLPPPEHLDEVMITLAEPSFSGNGMWIAGDAKPVTAPSSDAVN